MPSPTQLDDVTVEGRSANGGVLGHDPLEYSESGA